MRALAVTVRRWRPSDDGRQGTVGRVTVRGDRATPRCQRICNFAFSCKLHRSAYPRRCRDGAHERCRDCDLHGGGGLTLDYADAVEFLDAFKPMIDMALRRRLQ
jgi:hypothetical protein